MAGGEEPLLARPTSPQSSIQDLAEEDALLTGQPTARSEDKRHKWRELGLFAWALLATAAVVAMAVVLQHDRQSGHNDGGWGRDGKPSGKRNMIFMVSDGMGPTSLALTRSYRQYVDGLPIDDVLLLDKHHIGTSRTRSSSSLITDSAAGATAFSCGFKSYNGAISVLPDHTPCGTVLEAAKKAGYMTGLVVTTRLTDATPACFAAHANRREYEDLIAEQMIGHYPLGRVVDVMIGGGRCHFLPNTTDGSCRADSKDVVAMARDNGFHYFDSRKEFDQLASQGEVKLPLLGLVASTDIPYEIDRVHVNDVYPSESEMAKLALDALSAATKNSDKGFFIMIEGSRIDHAGHGNDPAAQVREVLAHDSAFSTVLDFLDKDSTPGILVSTSDHETGGLATARQLTHAYPHYLWYPGVLANASHSAEYASQKWNEYLSSDIAENASRDEKRVVVQSILVDDLGVMDYDSSEVSDIIDAASDWPPSYLFADMISRRAQIGWSTHGHSGVDVNIYASAPEHAPGLVGNHENIEVGRFMAEYLDVDVEAVTQELRSKHVKTGNSGLDFPEVETADAALERLFPGEEMGDYAWMGPEGLPVNDNGQLAVLDAYHGDFKHRKREELDCGCGMKH